MSNLHDVVDFLEIGYIFDSFAHCKVVQFMLQTLKKKKKKVKTIGSIYHSFRTEQFHHINSRRGLQYDHEMRSQK